jgi:transcriptional regulator with XRE-family HTH domain
LRGLAFFIVRRTMATSFALKLREYRQRRNIPLAALARNSGLSKSMIWRLEVGTRTPSRQTVVALSKALNLTGPQTRILHVAAGFIPQDEQTDFSSTANIDRLHALAHAEWMPVDVRSMIEEHANTTLRLLSGTVEYNGKEGTLL